MLLDMSFRPPTLVHEVSHTAAKFWGADVRPHLRDSSFYVRQVLPAAF